MTLKRCICDPMLIKPRCVSYADNVFNNTNCVCKFLNLKHILALTTCDKKCSVLVLLPFTFEKFQTKHPSLILFTLHLENYYLKHNIRIIGMCNFHPFPFCACLSSIFKYLSHTNLMFA